MTLISGASGGADRVEHDLPIASAAFHVYSDQSSAFSTFLNCRKNVDVVAGALRRLHTSTDLLVKTRDESLLRQNPNPSTSATTTMELRFVV
jgi:hypothetical protein